MIHNDVRAAVEYATISRVLPTCSLRKRQNAGSANASSITHDLTVLTKPMQVCRMNMLLNKHSHSFVNATPASRALPKSSSRDTYSHDIFLKTNTVFVRPLVIDA